MLRKLAEWDIVTIGPIPTCKETQGRWIRISSCGSQASSILEQSPGPEYWQVWPQNYKKNSFIRAWKRKHLRQRIPDSLIGYDLQLSELEFREVFLFFCFVF